MTTPESPLVFLAMVGFISLSGVIMPGPLFAATVAKGYRDVRAGLKIAIGHAVIEIPLIIAVFFGLDYLFKDQAVFALIGILGGAILVYMGYSMIRSRESMMDDQEEVKYGAFMAGIITTVTNPYFFLWWATVGAALITGAIEFGLIILPFFILVHLACDFGWEHFVSFSIFKTKGLWSRKRHHLIFLVSGIIMLVFGVYFFSSSVISLV